MDSVSDVVRLPGEQIRAASELGVTINRQLPMGIGRLDDRMLILLDERLMTSTEMGLIVARSAPQPPIFQLDR